jgi:hypothetical protein
MAPDDPPVMELSASNNDLQLETSMSSTATTSREQTILFHYDRPICLISYEVFFLSDLEDGTGDCGDISELRTTPS